MRSNLIISEFHLFYFKREKLFINLFQNKLPEVPGYAKMQLDMMTLPDVMGKIAMVR